MRLAFDDRWNVWLMYIEQTQYPTSSPSPNLQRPNPNTAPFYMAGAEVPPQGGPPSAQPQQQQYPQREQGQRHPSAGKQPAPIQTSSPPPSNNPYAAYQAPGANQRPPSTYGGAPQELSTSVYDSPIAPHNPNSAATYSSSVYSPEDGYGQAGPNNGGPPNSQAPSAPPPSAPNPDQRQTYQPYTAYHTPQQPSQPYGRPYESVANEGPHPPAPTGQAPPPPIPQGRPDNVLTPPPLQPSGSAYDARQTLPSRIGGYPSPPAQQHPDAGQQPPQQPQYKAYIPPGGPAPGNDGPSAPSDYYRTSAY